MLIDGKSFFDVPVKNKDEAYENIMRVSKNNDYTTVNFLDYEYFAKHYKLTALILRYQQVILYYLENTCSNIYKNDIN